ncbi:hypothetical protein [Haloarcula argentinensis]|uniref:Uncharacterized protein n=1 Tax=Haloarcula argentinensis TaxID=43776 RepID=A0A847U894_HALAR|nr:hypothetical protein [Haloarcula argentinensis]NLV11963.1 hypothetical protein [Haloarcula argentinensis]
MTLDTALRRAPSRRRPRRKREGRVAQASEASRATQSAGEACGCRGFVLL